MAPNDPSIEITVRARYAETDAMGVVHHASYIVWLEQARTELLRACGVTCREIEAAGFLVMLTGLQARYLAPARFDDLVAIRAELLELRSRKLSFGYQLRLTGQDTLLVVARSEHVVVARASGRPARLPAALLEALQVNSQELAVRARHPAS